LKKVSILLSFMCFFVAFLANAATVNKVAAVVNGNMITVHDLQKIIKPELVRANIDPRNPANQAAIDSMIRRALDMEIFDILIAEEAARLKLTVSDTEIEGEIAAIMANSRLSKQDFERQLSQEGLTVDGLRKRISKNILRQKLMGMMVGRKVVITPEEIKEYYEKNIKYFSQNSAVNLALIIYPNNVNAEDWAKKIKDKKVTFQEAAKSVSIGPNPENGGDVGQIPFKEISLVLRTQLNSIEPGQISNIFTLNDRKAQLYFKSKTKASGTAKLEDMSKEIEATLREPRTMERFNEYQQQLKDKAVIDIRI